MLEESKEMGLTRYLVPKQLSGLCTLSLCARRATSAILSDPSPVPVHQPQCGRREPGVKSSAAGGQALKGFGSPRFDLAGF